MEKEFNPYELALALKELGFNERCFGFWQYKNGKIKHITTEEGSYNNRFHKPNSDFFWVSAPLYQQAFRWLLALANKDKNFTNKWSISYNEDYYSLFLGGCNMGVFEEEIECLKKLIEIVKEK
jgi:hypothetical protein